MKPFDLELAKAGHPVCTRGGLSARILCFDLMTIDHRPIISGVRMGDFEVALHHYANGAVSVQQTSDRDLFMAPRKEKRWLVVWFDGDYLKCVGYKHQTVAEDSIRSRPGYELHEIEVTLP